MIDFLKKHPVFVKAFVLGYVVFTGCFVFPISSERFPLTFMDIYLLVISYGVIALSFSALYGPQKEKTVYILSFLLTALGLLCRYLLEYGEVSNTYNFTPINIISYLVLIPLGVTVFYHFIIKMLISNKKK